MAKKHSDTTDKWVVTTSVLDDPALARGPLRKSGMNQDRQPLALQQGARKCVQAPSRFSGWASGTDGNLAALSPSSHCFFNSSFVHGSQSSWVFSLSYSICLKDSFTRVATPISSLLPSTLIPPFFEIAQDPDWAHTHPLYPLVFCFLRQRIDIIEMYVRRRKRVEERSLWPFFPPPFTFLIWVWVVYASRGDG